MVRRARPRLTPRWRPHARAGSRPLAFRFMRSPDALDFAPRAISQLPSGVSSALRLLGTGSSRTTPPRRLPRRHRRQQPDEVASRTWGQVPRSVMARIGGAARLFPAVSPAGHASSARSARAREGTNSPSPQRTCDSGPGRAVVMAPPLEGEVTIHASPSPDGSVFLVKTPCTCCSLGMRGITRTMGALLHAGCVPMASRIGLK